MDLKNNHITYVEFKAIDLELTKKFYGESFSWKFKDHGASYVAFSKSGLRGGFEKSDVVINGALIVLYHEKLDKIKEKIVKHGGTISVDTFAFPGGRRFHFMDPSGNELAVWSDK